MKLTSSSKCLIATPVSHLPAVKNFIVEHNEYFVLNENGDVDSVTKSFIDDPCIRYIFVNPNAQGYFIDEDFINKTRLLGINTCSTGTNHIDLTAVKKKQLDFFSLTNDLSLISQLPSTAELAFGLMIGLCRSIVRCNFDVVANGNWDYTSFMGSQLKGKRVGIVGYGRLGKMFANMLKGFDVETVICEKNAEIDVGHYQRLEINHLFATSDIVVLHIHSTSENKKLVDKNLIGLMKENSYLINTSRGDICDEGDICTYLQNGKLGGYATDVLATEFTNIKHSPLYQLARQGIYNIIITPHVGGMTYEGQEKAFLHALKKFQFS